MTALIVQPPLRRFRPTESRKSMVFLAGSIEMGSAENWQPTAIERLKHHTSVIFNPRRDDWNSDWEQSIDHPEFNAQVNWELDMIEKSTMVVFHFDPNTKSPITLMELGIVSNRTAAYGTFVSCPKGFWRKGNVDILCERNRIPVFDNLDDMLGAAVANAVSRSR